jgi:hypothetical protein
MNDRHTVDSITSDQLDALYERVARAERSAERAEAAIKRVRALIAPYDWQHAEVSVARIRKALDEPTPEATEATEPGRCCGKPAGAICVHDVTPPADQTTEK